MFGSEAEHSVISDHEISGSEAADSVTTEIFGSGAEHSVIIIRCHCRGLISDVPVSEAAGSVITGHPTAGECLREGVTDRLREGVTDRLME